MSVHLEKPRIETFRIVEKTFNEDENHAERLRKFNTPQMPAQDAPKERPKSKYT